LKDLGLEYLDLYLIHFPIPLEFVPFETRYPAGWSVDGKSMVVTMKKVSIHETWGAMEQLVDQGMVKQIGVANFSCVLLREVICLSNRLASLKLPNQAICESG
jgi:D-xylose reductase